MKRKVTAHTVKIARRAKIGESLGQSEETLAQRIDRVNAERAAKRRQREQEAADGE